jgi:tetratricopeptide (TPR) repeat protein
MNMNENLEDTRAWLERGTMLAKLGNYASALECFNKVTDELDPKNEFAWLSKGLALATLGNIESALECFAKVTELDPKNADGWNHRGNMLFKLGRIEEAKQCKLMRDDLIGREYF